jgi:hypothetical protein
MFNRFLARTVMASLVAVGMTLGCDGRSPSGPTPLTTSAGPTAPAAPTVTVVSPNTGSTLGTPLVTIRGTGFDSREGGPWVTFGSAATSVTVVNSMTITAAAPAHTAGTVDVVVTNPDGQSTRLAEAFTYVVDQPYTVTPSSNTATPGGQLSVSWTAPRGGVWDWIGLFNLGEPSTNYEQHWWRYTEGATSGTFTLAAPTQQGQYEFRYLLDDGFVDSVRSSPVTVSAGGAPLREP